MITDEGLRVNKVQIAGHGEWHIDGCPSRMQIVTDITVQSGADRTPL